MPARDALSKRALIGLVFCFSGLMLTVAAFPRGNTVLLIARPGTSEASMMRIVGDAGANLIARGHLPWIGVVQSDEPGLARRLFASGALLVVNQSLAVGCQSGVTE